MGNRGRSLALLIDASQFVLERYMLDMILMAARSHTVHTHTRETPIMNHQ
jgi:hypothetical protein